jgi:hypothetical protein
MAAWIAPIPERWLSLSSAGLATRRATVRLRLARARSTKHETPASTAPGTDQRLRSPAKSRGALTMIAARLTINSPGITTLWASCSMRSESCS